MRSAFFHEFRNSLMLQLTYRANFVFTYLVRVAQLLISLLVWRVIFDERIEVQGYSWGAVGRYLVMVSGLSLLLQPTHLFKLHPLIQQGTLSNLLLRPARYSRHCFAQFLGEKTPLLIASAVFVLSMTALLGIHSSPPLSMFAFALPCLGILLSFFLGLSISCLAFWIVEMWPLKRIFEGGMILLGGLAAPLDLYPSLLQKIAWCTPFPYLGSVPSRAMLSAYDHAQLLHHILSAAAWVGFSFVVYRVLWARGLKRYEAVNA